MTRESDPAGLMANRSMPPGTIIPELGYRDVDSAVPWLCTTIGFKERLRIGNHRSQLVLGDASVIVVAQGDGLAAHEGALTHSLMVRVADADQLYAHVKECGARIISPPTDYPFGERQLAVDDLAGHRWTFSQSIADVDPSEWGGTLRERANVSE